MANITVEWLGCPRGRGKHETMEFVYEETEETEGEMYQWCKGWGWGESLREEDRV